MFHLLTPMLPRPTPLARRAAALAMIVCLALALPAAPVAWQAPDIALIAHPDVPVDNLTLADLRRLLLGDREFWSSGVRVTLFIRAPIARERDAMVKDVCEMTEAQFRQHWIGKVFRAETANGPKIVYSAQMAIDQVSRTPGAIAFVEATPAPKGVKIIKIDGKAPGQSGYRLK